MPRYEVSGKVFKTAKIHFSKKETDAIADGASAAALMAVCIPEPAASKSFAAAAGLCALIAKRAQRQDKALGLTYRWPPLLGPIPFFHDDSA